MDPRRLLPALTMAAGACVLATLAVAVVRPGDSPATARVEASSPSAGEARPGPAGILAAWDEQRASAWAAGDTEALRDLYVAGSRTGAADLRVLRHYRARGLTVTGLATQMLSLGVVERSESRLVLLVTDRVVGGRAVGGGSTPIALPTDRASTRLIVLVRRGGTWRVAEARDQASAAASTSRTSSSWKS